ncbi:MAG TPA: GFA family protein [Burkholderiales bacterium]|jgi:hypothetical protein|nr:GFA family protein [Burkholderiales bacterium]HEX2650759.1 GFA family protein [Burkholderiales bacterium]
MDITGRCHCGDISYRASVDPAKVSICHCTDCQKLSGSPYRVAVPAQAKDFKLLTGIPRTYVKTAESGAKRVQAFCGNCGSPVYSTSPDPKPASYSLRVGLIDQRAELPPRHQIWCGSALEWCTDIEMIPGVDRQ